MKFSKPEDFLPISTPAGDTGPRSTIVHAIAERAGRSPDRVALVFGRDEITYEQFIEQVLDGAAWFEGRGVGPGDKVAVLTTNHPLAMVAAVAALYVGATWVPANPRDGASDIGAILDRSLCDVLLARHAGAGVVDQISERAPSLRVVEPLTAITRPRAGKAPVNRALPDNPAAIFFTGGTTGRPKGVVFLHRNFLVLADSYVELMVAEDEVTLAAAPLTHVAGRQCLASLSAGAKTIIVPAFDPAAVLDAVEEHRVTAMTATPTMLYMLLNEPDVRARDTSSLRRVGYGAAPIALDRLKEAIEIFGPVLQGGYGQTESPMLISCLRPSEHLVDGHLADDRILRSVGRPTPASDVRVLGPDAAELGHGKVGEIVVAGDYQMHEYYGDPVATAAARWGRFVRTGDLGMLDSDGYLTICGRIKDMIITGGFNVFAAEVESALSSHHAVYESAVFGLPDDLWGESVTAAVQLRPGETIEPAELQAWVRERIGGVKTPKRIEVVDDIPRNQNGKILKRLLVERFAPVASSMTDFPTS
jgi:fatty-acyl-CoA synthase